MTGKVHIIKKVWWHPAVWRSRLRLQWPFFIWVAAIAAAFFLYQHGGRFGGMSGVVDTVRVQISPIEDARLHSILVSVGQEVRKGDPVALMDTTLLDAELMSERLQADRQFAQDVTTLSLDLQDARLRFAEAQGELEVLEAEMDRLEELLDQRIIDRQTVSRLRTRRGALEKMVQAYPQLIAEIEQALSSAEARRESVGRWLGTPEENAQEMFGSEPTEGAHTEHTGWLSLRRREYVLRAGMDGVISSIDHEVGEVIPAGEGVLSIVSHDNMKVVGFLPETYAHEAEVGMTAYLTRPAVPGDSIQARVDAIAPEVLTLPMIATPVQSRVLRGRRVVLVPEGGHGLLPGETVEINLEYPWLTVAWEKIRNMVGRLFNREE